MGSLFGLANAVGLGTDTDKIAAAAALSLSDLGNRYRLK